MEHTATGEPVGSRTITSRHELGLSSATVRSVLAHLEEAGLAWQPHASAGRVPTQRAYRYYVDSMFEPVAPSEQALRVIAENVRPGRSVASLARDTSRVLSALTGAVGLVATLGQEETVLSQLRFVRLERDRLVAVLAARDGRVEHRTIEHADALSDSELDHLHAYLGSAAPGRTLRELRDTIARDVEGNERELGLLHLRLERLLDATIALEDVEDRVVIEGQSRLFHLPEFGDAEKIRAYVDAFASKRRWLELLERTLSSTDSAMVIGGEAAIDGLEDVGVVAVRCGSGPSSSGLLAVVGPLRVDYALALPLLRAAARAVTEALPRVA